MGIDFDFNEMIECLNVGPALGSVLKAIIVLAVVFVGYFIAKIIAGLIRKGLVRLGVDNLFKKSELKLSRLFGKLTFYLLMIIVLMVVLEWLKISYVLDPLKDMMSKFLVFVPNLVLAALVAYLGYFFAKIVSDLIETFGDAIEKFSIKLKMPNNVKLTNIIKKVVFIFIFIPVLIISLDTLQVDVISDPAKNVLQTFMDSVPKILLAVVIVVVAVVVGRFVIGLLKDLLTSLNVNNLKNTLNLDHVLGKTDLVSVICGIAYFLIVYVASIQALDALEFLAISALLYSLLAIFAKIAFGLVILAIGGAVAKFAAEIYSKGEDANKFLGSIIKGAVLVIFLAIGLSTMGLATDIINLAFGLGIGAIAVAFALSFGLGGREAAGKEMENFFKKFKKDKKD